MFTTKVSYYWLDLDVMLINLIRSPVQHCTMHQPMMRMPSKYEKFSELYIYLEWELRPKRDIKDGGRPVPAHLYCPRG